MRKRPRRTGGLLVALMAAVFLACCIAPARAWAAEKNSLKEVYVSNAGKDDASGELGAPVATLGEAVNAVQDGGIIYVMSNLEATETVKVWEKHITVTSYGNAEGQPWKIIRSEGFAPSNDTRRSGYNGAMFEVGAQEASPEGEDFAARLTLENIILDDMGRHAGKYFIQAIAQYQTPYTPTTAAGHVMTGSEGYYSNTDIVQDAIVASYDGTGEIVLGEGASLQNYGGMSAVYVAGGSSLHMLSGSSICDTMDIPRAKQTVSGACDNCNDTHNFDLDFGPAGAVWMHWSSATVEAGASLSNLTGRGFYNEGGSISFDGIAQNIKSSNTWQGTDGYVIYLRGEGSNATLGGNARVSNEGIEGEVKGYAFLVPGGASLDVKSGAVISDIYSDRVIHVTGNNSALEFDGEMRDCTAGYTLIACEDSYVEANLEITRAIFGPNSFIHDCTVDGTAGAVYTWGYRTVEFRGKICDNVGCEGAAVWIANNGAGGTSAAMYPGAIISGNVASGEKAGGIIVTSGTFTMEGGTIEDNIAANGVGGGVLVYRGGTFIMKDGSIRGNCASKAGGNIAVETGELLAGWVPRVEIQGGTVSDGMMNAQVTKAGDGAYTATDGDSNDVSVLVGEKADVSSLGENVTLAG